MPDPIAGVELFGGPLDGARVRLNPESAILIGASGEDDPPGVHHVYALRLLGPPRLQYVQTIRDETSRLKATKLKGGLDK